MRQRQLNVLVERCRAGALVCVVAGAAWVRWLAASKVFDEMMVAEGARQGRGCAGTEAFCHWRCQSVNQSVSQSVCASVQLLPLKEAEQT
jgi:hypothetical protein